MQESLTLRQEIINAGIRLLGLTDGLDILQTCHITLRNPETGTTLNIVARPNDVTQEAAYRIQLSPVEKKILRVATPEPKTVEVLARLAGYSAKSNYFRDALRSLERHNPPLIIRTPDGYRLAPSAAQSVPLYKEITPPADAEAEVEATNLHEEVTKNNKRRVV